MNFEIQKHQNEFNFVDVLSKNNLSNIKIVAYIVTLDEYKSIGTHWIALCVNGNNIIDFYSFRVEHI